MERVEWECGCLRTIRFLEFCNFFEIIFLLLSLNLAELSVVIGNDTPVIMFILPKVDST